MSKIIKAAELKVLVPNEAQTVIHASNIPGEVGASSGATILDGTNLIHNAKAKAEAILERAEEEAKARLEQMENQIDTIRLQAKEAGFADGYEEGLVEGQEKALEEAGKLLSTVHTIIDEGVRLRAQSLEALEDDFLKLSLLLADKIVRKNIQNDIAWLDPIIKDAIRSLGTVEKITVLLNPMDYSLIKEEEEGLQLGTRAKLYLERDPSITQGGCLIESESGLIDARLEKRLGKIGQYLMEVLYNE